MSVDDQHDLSTDPMSSARRAVLVLPALRR